MHPAPIKIHARHELPNGSRHVRTLDSGERIYTDPNGSVYALQRPPRPTALERCERTVALIAQATGEPWTFGYIGNDNDVSWYAFRPHPGRVGTHEDRIGGVPTDQLDDLLPMLMGALKMARMLSA